MRCATLTLTLRPDLALVLIDLENGDPAFRYALTLDEGALVRLTTRELGTMWLLIAILVEDREAGAVIAFFGLPRFSPAAFLQSAMTSRSSSLRIWN